MFASWCPYCFQTHPPLFFWHIFKSSHIFPEKSTSCSWLQHLLPASVTFSKGKNSQFRKKTADSADIFRPCWPHIFFFTKTFTPGLFDDDPDHLFFGTMTFSFFFLVKNGPPPFHVEKMLNFCCLCAWWRGTHWLWWSWSLQGIWSWAVRIPSSRCGSPITFLGGGFKDFLFSPQLGGNGPIWQTYFSNGWFNHQLGFYDLELWQHATWLFLRYLFSLFCENGWSVVVVAKLVWLFFWFMLNKLLRNWKVFFQNKPSVSVHFFGDDWSVITSHQMHILEGRGWNMTNKRWWTSHGWLSLTASFYPFSSHGGWFRP